MTWGEATRRALEELEAKLSNWPPGPEDPFRDRVFAALVLCVLSPVWIPLFWILFYILWKLMGLVFLGAALMLPFAPIVVLFGVKGDGEMVKISAAIPSGKSEEVKQHIRRVGGVLDDSD